MSLDRTIDKVVLMWYNVSEIERMALWEMRGDMENHDGQPTIKDWKVRSYSYSAIIKLTYSWLQSTHRHDQLALEGLYSAFSGSVMCEWRSLMELNFSVLHLSFLFYALTL